MYVDESYLHQKHSSNYTYFHPDSADGNKVFCGSGKGQRLIILHAITKDGLLSVDGHERQIDDTWELQKAASTSEWVFVGKIKKMDYHKNMNGDNFMRWVQLCLIPSFEAKYPNKTMILVLDNAPYHHCRGDDYIDIRNMKRKELLYELMQTAKVKSMKIQRPHGEVVVELAPLRNSKKGSPKANKPLNDELRAELQKYVDAHPETQTGELQKCFDYMGWQLIWTPPYMPTLQPIELLWAFSKGRVAAKFETDRSVEETRMQYFDALYGDGKGDRGYTAKLCRDHIRHCHDWCNKYISDDPKLSGTIYDLETNTIPHPQESGVAFPLPHPHTPPHCYLMSRRFKVCSQMTKRRRFLTEMMCTWVV